MNRFILRKKNQIVLISFILIVTGFIFKFSFHNDLLFEILLIIASIIGVLPIAIQAFSSLRVKVISIDLLVTIAVIGAFIIKNYEESAIVTFLFLFGDYLEKRTILKTRSAIKELVKLQPDSAMRLNELGEFELVDIDFVDVDDILLVKTGDKIPVDGIVIEGNGYINEANITGESVPVKKEINNSVYASTILDNGTIKIKTSSVGEETTFGKIIELVEEAQDSKSTTEKFINSFAKYYTPFILVLALIVYLIIKDIEIAITILVLGCPGALVIGVPISNVAGIGNGAKNGVLLKGSEVINDFSKIDVVAFDKTGTLTIGKPEVSNIINYYDNEEKAKNYLLTIEKDSNHPLGVAIVNYLSDSKLEDINNIDVVKGYGIKALINKEEVLVGNLNLMINNNVDISDLQLKDINSLETLGNSIVLLAINNVLALLVGIKDQIRPNLKNDLIELKNSGVKEFVILSGDSQVVVDQVASSLGISKAYGAMLPNEKQEYLIKLQKQGKKVAFVGDGINDSPSIASANVGISMGNGTDVAIETSDIVLIKDSFKSLTHAHRLSKKISSNMKQNIFIAVFVVALLLSGLLFELVNMSIGMLVHEVSILVVILNGMRLIRFNNKGGEKK